MLAYIVGLAMLILTPPASGIAYHLRYDSSGELSWAQQKVEFHEEASQEERAKTLIYASFGKNSPNFAPPDTKILTLLIHDDHLILNLSKQALSFGESYYEELIRRQITKTALAIDGIKRVTILVNNSKYYRVEKA